MTTKTTDRTEIDRRIERLAEAKKRYDAQHLTDAAHAAAFDEIVEGHKTGYGPLVGMPCTYNIGSDRYAATVTWVSPSAHQVKVLREGEGVSAVDLCTRRKDGRYRSKGHGSAYIIFLVAETYLDPSF